MLSVKENSLLNVLVIINSNELSKLKSSLPAVEKEDQKAKELLEESAAKLLKNIRKDVYFDILPQTNKQIVMFDIFNDDDSNDEVYRLREMILNFVKFFD